MDSSPKSTASSDLYSPSESVQLEAAPITNGIKHGVPHKRKWEEDPISSSDMPKKRKSPAFHKVIDCDASAVQAPSSPQAKTFMENSSRTERPRANGCVIGIETDLSCISSTLPAALWQHILCHVPPVFLGRMLSVNHAFNTYLTPGKNEEDLTPLPNSTVQPLKSEAIWAISRRKFYPGIPRPIQGLKELDMWKLLKGTKCQICGKVKIDLSIANPQGPWESGPGDTGIRAVWPFGIRCCGPCLQEHTQKVVPDCQHHSLATIRHRKLTVARNWIFPCRPTSRFSFCRVSRLPSYPKLPTTLVIACYEA